MGFKAFTYQLVLDKTKGLVGKAQTVEHFLWFQTDQQFVNYTNSMLNKTKQHIQRHVKTTAGVSG